MNIKELDRLKLLEQVLSTQLTQNRPPNLAFNLFFKLNNKLFIKASGLNN